MKNQHLLIAAASMTLTVSPAFAAVTLTGDATTTTGMTFQSLGNSQDTAIMADNVGAGFAYDIYYGTYIVDAGDTVSGSNIVGNTIEGATGGTFNAGDKILVIGWNASTQNPGGTGASESNGYLKFDPNNNGGYLTAAEAGGPVTSFSGGASDAGDFQLETSRNSFNEQRVVNFRFNDGVSTSVYPMQGGANTAFTDGLANVPFRTFGIDSSGDSGSETLTSQLILLNVTDLNASSFNGQDVNDIGNTFEFYMQQGNAAGTTGVVVDVPEPGSLALLGLGGLALIRRRRRA